MAQECKKFNVVPRVLSVGRVGENPGNEVAKSLLPVHVRRSISRSETNCHSVSHLDLTGTPSSRVRNMVGWLKEYTINKTETGKEMYFCYYFWSLNDDRQNPRTNPYNFFYATTIWGTCEEVLFSPPRVTKLPLPQLLTPANTQATMKQKWPEVLSQFFRWL